MKISRQWLQKYFEKELPSVAEIADAYTFHSFEIEEIAGDVLDVKVLPNRAADCLSVRGLAKELSAILDIPLKSDPLRTPIQGSTFAPNSKVEPWNALEVEIEDAKKCPRYMAALVRGVQVKASPDWLREALESVGQRSINNIVDATNYVMLNIGQPLHAFDAAKLKQQEGAYRIRVRTALAEEAFVALGGAGYHVPEGTSLITDGNTGAPIALAGVKGGIVAELTDATTDIIIESANFDGTAVRKTAQALKLFTDASLRFQNRPSPELAAYGMRDVLALITEIAGGEVAGVVDAYSNRSTWQYRIGTSAQEISAILGREYSPVEIADVFARLDLPFEQISLEKVLAKQTAKLVSKAYKNPSSMRFDAPDSFSCSSLASYIFVLAGYWMPSISVDKYVFGTPVVGGEEKRGDLVFANTGVGKVHTETVEYRSGTKVPEGIDHVGIYLGEGKVLHATVGRGVVIENLEESPRFKNVVGYRRIAADADEERFVVTAPFERTDLRIREDLVEEVGRIIGYDKINATELPAPGTAPDQARYRGIEKMKDQMVEQGFTEVSTQSFAKKGDIELANPLDKAKPYLRTSLEANLKEALVVAKHYAPLVLPPNTKPKLFEVGTVFPSGGEFMELRMTETAWEGVPTHDNLTVAKLEEYGKDYVPKRHELGAYQAFSIYPFIVRDIAFWIPGGLAEDSIGAAFEKILSAAVSGANLSVGRHFLDRFEKEGKTSLAYRLVFESMERTLTDEEVNTIMEKIYAALRAAGYEIR